MTVTDTLLLNADYRPVRIVAWQRALTLLLDHKVTAVADYPGRLVRSPSISLPWPAVVALKEYVAITNRIKLSRQNVLARDGYACLYCGVEPRSRSGNPILEDLTIDHVVPRAQSSYGIVRHFQTGRPVPVTSWENVVSACVCCNSQKGGRTPEEAGMTLRKLPRKPEPWETIRMAFTRVAVPAEWKDYLPKDSAWRDYWEGELED